MFDQLLAANARYRTAAHNPDLMGTAAEGLAVLTCIDCRIDPLAAMGLSVGDAKIHRNAGARVTPDALRSLILATNLLGVTRVCIVQHTECAMARNTEGALRAKVAAARGRSADHIDFLAMDDQLAALRRDAELVKACDLMPPDIVVGGFMFDVRTGELRLEFTLG